MVVSINKLLVVLTFVIVLTPTVRAWQSLPTNFTLQDVLDLYGEPTAFTYSQSGPNEMPPISIVWTLYYPEEGLVIDFMLYEGVPLIYYVLHPDLRGINI